ncbi:MAG: phosphotransferase [Proteobacteria bacterium]|nr:phosphotransferase [Pseudomonadota bacterium]
MPENDARLALVHNWLSKDLGIRPERVEPASSDASFRRYYRAFRNAETFVIMDAPPDKEDVRPYMKVTGLLESLGVHVPHILEADVANGLLLLEDLGVTQYLQRLNAGDDADRLYGDALYTLAEIQTRGTDAARELAPYDRELLARELSLMPEWFTKRHLGQSLTDAENQIVADTFEFLIGEALMQPTVFVHRDFHSRNLMVTSERNPGVIDFQDAVSGPIGYDLVSVLKDCYIGWPRERVEQWVSGYRNLVRSRGGPGGRDNAEFLRWFDLIGMQRHIKVLGIFARLWYRDGKSGYLRDLPLTLEYVRDTAHRYPELKAFAELVERRFVMELPEANARVLGASAFALANVQGAAGGAPLPPPRAAAAK